MPASGSGLNIEEYLPGVKFNGLNSAKAVDFSSAPSVALPAGTTIAGTTAAGATTITSAGANALAVGPNGATTPALNVDASTASAITGLNIKSAGTGNGLALTTTGGTNEALTIDAKGSGTLSLNVTATGNIVLGRAATGVSLAVTGPVTTRSATAVAAAASVTPAFLTSSTALLGLYWGTGDPSTALTAAKGSLYLRTDGSSTSTRAYINTDGATAWTAVTTAG